MKEGRESVCGGMPFLLPDSSRDGSCRWFTRTVAPLAGLTGLFAGGMSPAYGIEPKFEPQTLDASIGIGYGVAVGDVDGDGKPDVLLADAREVVWYRNGDWKKHRICGALTARDHVCIAARDVDGDGKVEIAVGAQWNPGETQNALESGAVFYLQRPAGGEGDWKPVALPHDPTVHRMQWIQGSDGKFSLIVLPLHGIGNRNGAGANGVRIQCFPFPATPGDAAGWKPVVLADQLHVTHNLDVVPQTPGEEFLVGAREGFLQGKAAAGGNGWETALHEPESATGLPGFAGIGEIRAFPSLPASLGDPGDPGKKAGLPGKPEVQRISAIEPFHGPHLAVYDRDRTGIWKRTVVDSTLNQGHALACGFLVNSSQPQIVAGWREPNASGEFGIRIYWQEEAGAPWKSAWVASGNRMACEDLKVADLNADGKPDIIASGRSTKNLEIYWNRSPGGVR